MNNYIYIVECNGEKRAYTRPEIAQNRIAALGSLATLEVIAVDNANLLPMKRPVFSQASL